MLKLTISAVSLLLLWLAWVLNGILAHSEAPSISWAVAGCFLAGLFGLTISLLSALKTIREWQERRA